MFIAIGAPRARFEEAINRGLWFRPRASSAKSHLGSCKEMVLKRMAIRMSSKMAPRRRARWTVIKWRCLLVGHQAPLVSEDRTKWHHRRLLRLYHHRLLRNGAVDERARSRRMRKLQLRRRNSSSRWRRLWLCSSKGWWRCSRQTSRWHMSSTSSSKWATAAHLPTC